MKKKESRIPIGNYIKLFLIIVLTLVGLFSFKNLYLKDKFYEESTPLIRDYVVSEINTNEIYNYIRENGELILYICTSNNKNCRNFEKEFGPLIKERELENEITYLNLNNVKKKSSFIKEFNKFYDTKVLGYPSLVLFEEGKVKDILTVKTDKELKIEQVKEFFTKNNISSAYYD